MQQDTLYCFAILDLRRKPIVISVPDVAEPNSYLLQLGDTSTETPPYISTLTTGNRAGAYAIVGPGQIPSTGLDGVITTRGQFGIVVGRVSILDPDDLAPLHQIQAGMNLTSLSDHLGTPAPPEPPAIDFPDYDDDYDAGIGAFT